LAAGTPSEERACTYLWTLQSQLKGKKGSAFAGGNLIEIGFDESLDAFTRMRC